jgi:hypothetical protein
MKSPDSQKSDNWRDAVCRKCKSTGSLDYGTVNEYANDDDVEYCSQCGADTSNPCGCIDESEYKS